MQRARSNNERGLAATSGPAARTSGGLLRRVGAATALLCLLAAIVLAGGFLWFAWSLPGEEVTLTTDADGIVVLTGGASRTSDAIELLAVGRGKRLLISGANRATNSTELKRLNPDYARLAKFIDFDHSLNTLGNAIETRKWAETLKIRSLIVVTSAYHMPRAMAEIAHQLPHVTLIAFPVVSERLRAEPWWSSAGTARLIGVEYLKFVFAQLRIQVNPGAGSDN